MGVRKPSAPVNLTTLERSAIDAHALIYEADQALMGVIRLLGEIDGHLDGVTGEQLLYLLSPVEERLEKALPMLERRH